MSDFVYHPTFAGPTAFKRIYQEGPEVPQPNVGWYFDIEEGDSPRQDDSVLTPEQERAAFLRYNYARWRASRAGADEITPWAEIAEHWKQVIVGYNLALVIAMVARRLGRNHYLYEETIAQCNRTVIRAVELFDVSLGNKFSTYACRGVLNEAGRFAKVDRRRSMEALPEGYEASTDPISERRAEEAEEARQESIQQIRDAFEVAPLSDSERRVIEMRFFSDSSMTLEQVGAVLGVCKERVRQIQNQALDKIKSEL